MCVVPIVAIGVLVSACSPGPSPLAIDGREVKTIELAMTDGLRFEPDQVEVTQRETVRFFIRNLTNEPHEASIGTAMEQEMHEQVHAGLPANEQQQTTHGYGIHIVPYGNGEIVHHFADVGEFIIGCHYPGHYAGGHWLTIEVKAAEN